MENMDNMDFEAMRDKQADELMQLLDERKMKELQIRLEDMNEFDVAEFLSEIEDNRMPMVFRQFPYPRLFCVCELLIP